jgi:hypothetical protein
MSSSCREDLEIGDKAMQKIYMAIRKISGKMGYMIIIFNHLERARNIAGLLLEQRKRKEEEEKFLTHLYHKQYYNGFMPYLLITA